MSSLLSKVSEFFGGKSSGGSAATAASAKALEANTFVNPKQFRAPAGVAVGVPLPGVKEPNARYAVTLDSVMNGAECAELIELTERKGYEPALVNVGGGQQVMMTDYRNSHRCIIDDPQRAALLWQRIKAFVPVTFQGRTVIGLNERLRFLRYDAGEFFAPHYDGTYERDNGERSMITYQLYLNEGFEGGDTSFLNPNSTLTDEQIERLTDNPNEVFGTIPATGRVLLFEHKLLHRGDLLRKGRKYCLRTDVMYSKAQDTKAVDTAIPTVTIAQAQAAFNEAKGKTAAATATATATATGGSGGSAAVASATTASGGSAGSAAVAADTKTATAAPAGKSKAIETEVNNPLSSSALTCVGNPLRDKLLSAKFGAAEAKAIVAKPFPLPLSAANAKGKFAVTLDGVLSASECATLIALTEELGYKKALINIGGGQMKLMEEYRNNDRVMLDDPALAEWLWQRVKPHVPAQWKGCKALGLNERLRFLRYDPGQQFAEHFDGRFERANGERSYVTFQLYLNEGFEGGATTFINWFGDYPVGHEPPTSSCVPKTGSVLLFEHAMLHRGDALIKNRKYALRTDVMYAPPN